MNFKKEKVFINMREILIPVILFAIGLFVIIKGGDAFVDAASWLSEVTGIPKLIVGATVISLATTLPELLVSAIATYEGSIGIATGNAIGSVIANIGIGMSLGLIVIPSAITRKTFAPKAILMIVVSVALLLFGLDGNISIVDSAILLLLLCYYIYSNVKSAKEESANCPAESRPETNSKIITFRLTQFILGAAGIIIGAKLLVDNGQIIAAAIGVSEEVIGLTVIAIGTSLPELVTAITAIVKKESALSVGNIIGANIIDMAMILPICSLISGGALAVSSSTVFIDIPFALFLMAVGVVPTIIAKTFKKWQGWVIILSYVGYLGYVVTAL